MAIIYRQGNAVDALIAGNVDFLIHCCNAQGVMGSGIAKEIKQRIPAAFKAYKQGIDFCDNKMISSLGSTSLGGQVINIVGQEFYGADGKRYVNYGALAQGLTDIISYLDEDNVVAVPYKMASDRAGGDWDIVLELLTHLVVPYVKDLVIYKL